MLGITDLKTGVAIIYEGDPCIVLSYEHSKLGRGGAIMRTKLKNLKSTATFDITFKGSDKFDEAPLQKRISTFLYAEGEQLVFMDTVSFEQFELPKTQLGSKVGFLKEGSDVQILFFDETPVSVELPIKLELAVSHTEPGVKGDTVSGGTKPAILESGAVIAVPLFIKIGDVLRVNTVEGTYVERAR